MNIILKEINQIHIESNYDELVNGLYPERRERVKKLSNKKTAFSMITAGYLLQDVLYEELGISSDEIIIDNNRYGKPFVKNVDGFVYNISHSGDYAVMAYEIMDKGDIGRLSIGVDIERIREKNANIAKRCFCDEEYEYIAQGTTESERNERFCRIWTMKESYLKCIGLGINIPLDAFLIDAEKLTVSSAVSKRGDNNKEQLSFDNIHFNQKKQGEYIISCCIQGDEKHLDKCKYLL